MIERNTIERNDAPSAAASYITRVAEADLTGETILDDIAAGALLKVQADGTPVAAVAGTDYAAGNHAHALDDLTDVAVAAPASGQVIRHNGTSFANSAIQAGDLPTGVDAAKLADGSVSNTEFQYLNGVTSDLQTQLDGKAPTSHDHAPADIDPQGAGSGLDADTVDGQHASAFATSGHNHDASYAALGHSHTVDGLSDATITSPQDGDVLTYDSGAGAWVNEAAGGGSPFPDEVAVENAADSLQAKLKRTAAGNIAEVTNQVNVAAADSKGLHFPGGANSRDFVTFSQAYPDVDKTHNWSVDFWVQRNGAGSGTQTLIAFGGAAGGDVVLCMDNGTPGVLQILVSGSAYFTTSTAVVTPNDTWVHVAVTWSAASLGGDDKFRVYKNGVLHETSGVIGSAFAGNATAMHWGRYTAGNSQFYFNGRLDEVVIHEGTTLTLEQVEASYNAGTGLYHTAANTPTATDLWHQDEGSGASITNPLRANVGTLNGLTAWITGKVPAPAGSDQEVVGLTVKDGLAGGEKGLVEAGNSQSRTRLVGKRAEFWTGIEGNTSLRGYINEVGQVVDLLFPGIIGHRLTLTTATPVTTADVTSASTLFLCPYRHQFIELRNSDGEWLLVETAQISLALAGLTSGKNYDVFAYWTGAGVALELSAAWTNDTTRADALTRVDGVLVKNADNTRRWVGIIRTTGTTTTADSAAKRFTFNGYNQVPRYLLSTDNTTRSTTSGTFVQIGTVQVEYVTDGFQEVPIVLNAIGQWGGATNNGQIAIGSSATAKASGSSEVSVQHNAIADPVSCTCAEIPAAGYVARFAIFKSQNGAINMSAIAAVDSPGTQLRGSIQC